jgi:predicted dehydrogenase
MRFGLVGTGYWARETHAAALLAADGVSLTAVWGRDAGRTEALAGDVGAAAHLDFDRFLAEVDAVSFSVPPDVQAELAPRAAAAGKHLLLEKPIATTPDAARAIEAAVEAAGVASVVFFTQLFRPEMRAWLAELAAAEHPWEGGAAVVLGSVQRETGPFSTPWRLTRLGGLWDLGPHALALVSATLGPVVSCAAHLDERGTAHLVLGHDGGASSVAVVSQSAPTAATGWHLRLWGGAGHAVMPDARTPTLDALGVAVAELVQAATSGSPSHPQDVTFGRQVVDTLWQAQSQLT